MSWPNELYKIYEMQAAQQQEGIMLLPVAHSTNNAQIEVTINEQGEFITARKIEDKTEAVTVIPVTEDSGSRSSGIAPHPLADKLVYLAGDYPEYVTGKRSDNGAYFNAYMQQLKGWKESSFTHPGVNAIYTYLDKSCLIENLIQARVLELNEDGVLKEKISIAGIAQEEAFVRFVVDYDDFSLESKTWEDQSLFESHIAAYYARLGNQQLCYATGKYLPCTYKHPSKIRNTGDKAKLISSNDESGFTYRGRFDDKQQALSVSYDFSQKVHNSLKWMIERQGIKIDSMVILVWESMLKQIPGLMESGEQENDEQDTGVKNGNLSMNPAFAAKLRGKIWKRDSYAFDSKVMIMVLDAATTGRLAVNQYMEIQTSEYLSRIEKWHQDTAWIRFNGKRKMNEINSFTPYEIAECAFGTEQGKFIKCKEDLQKDTICRLLPCILEGRKVPLDIMWSLVHRASKPLAYSETYNWRKVLEVACGIIRKKIIEDGGECQMGLDENCCSRDYLYGRLLAVADVAEGYVHWRENGKKDDKNSDRSDERITNAKRYFEAFANRPYQTWDYIYKRLVPYLNKMPKNTREWYLSLIQDITNKFEKEEYVENSRLKPEYLHAYHCQCYALYHQSEEKENQ